jgi:uncharacterized protein YegP (UPF0339 family)
MIKIHRSEFYPLVKHWWYTVHAANGKILTTSETFTRKANCMKSIYALLEVVRDQNVKVVDETK